MVSTRVPADQRDGLGAGCQRQHVAGWCRTVMPSAASRVSCSLRGRAVRARAGRSGSRAAAPSAPTRSASRRIRVEVVVDDGLVDLAGTDGGDQRLAPRPAGPGITRSRPPLAAGPAVLVANQSDMISAVEAPLALDDLVVDVVLLGGRDTVDVVVGGHDRPRLAPPATAISNGSRYSSRSVVSSTTLFMVFRAVSDSLATRCFRQAPTPLSCKPADVGGGELAGEQRVLGVRLEQPAAEQRAVQVDRRPEHDVDLLAPSPLRRADVPTS